MSERMFDLIRSRKVIVCCGAGGVGKTTTSTGIALAAARLGRRVLALTVDPSKRLAEVLGVERNPKNPVAMASDRMQAAGIVPPGILETWMLDPKLVAERAVARLVKDEGEMSRLTQNRIYKEVSRMVAGMQEYTAMEALHGFLRDGRYDLIVLDTPPSRNALDFLEGPGRLAQFIDGRIFQLFVPSADAGLFQQGAAKILSKVLSATFGEETHHELQEFFGSFASVFGNLNESAGSMRATLSDPNEVAFVLVSSPAAEALTDAYFFRKKTLDMHLPFRGFVLNRSQARADRRICPPEERFLGAPPTPLQASALKKLQRLAQVELAEVDRDKALLEHLGRDAGEGAFAIALPTVPGGANDMASLLRIADALVAS